MEAARAVASAIFQRLTCFLPRLSCWAAVPACTMGGAAQCEMLSWLEPRRRRNAHGTREYSSYTSPTLGFGSWLIRSSGLSWTSLPEAVQMRSYLTASALLISRSLVPFPASYNPLLPVSNSIAAVRTCAELREPGGCTRACRRGASMPRRARDLNYRVASTARLT